MKRAARLIVLLVALTACESEQPVTQLVVSLQAASAVSAAVRHVRVSLYEPGAQQGTEPADVLSFDVSQGPPAEGQVGFPFSFGVAKGRSSALLLVVEGFDNPEAAPLIEQKALANFTREQTLSLTVLLTRPCLGKAGTCAGLAGTCSAVAQAGAPAGSCVPVPTVTGGAVVPGRELDVPVEPTLLDPGPHYAAIDEKLVRFAAGGERDDELTAVTFDAAGRIVTAGTLLQPGAEDAVIMVARFSPAGDLDMGFGVGGVAQRNVRLGGSERAAGVVAQPDGKIVVAVTSGGLVHLVRFLPTGEPDDTFGQASVIGYNLATAMPRADTGGGLDAGTPSAEDGSSDLAAGLEQTSDGKLLLHATSSRLSAAGRTDAVLLKLNGDGSIDRSFALAGGVPGLLRTELGGGTIVAQGLHVLANGAIVGAAHAQNPLLAASGVQPLLYKLGVDGTRDMMFAGADPTPLPGVWGDVVRAGGASLTPQAISTQRDRLVVFGDGPTLGPGGGSDLVFFRLNPDGTRDGTFGTQGETVIDVGGAEDSAWDMVSLADQRVLAVGRGHARPSDSASAALPTSDALVCVLREDGSVDAEFGAGGCRLYDLTGSNDVLRAVAVSADGRRVAAVGTRSVPPQSGVEDDDSVLLLLNLR